MTSLQDVKLSNAIIDYIINLVNEMKLTHFFYTTMETLMIIETNHRRFIPS